MDLLSSHTVFFSPTHTSAKIARAITHGIAAPASEETDLTCDLSDNPILIRENMAVIAAPVYAGRVAPVALKRLGRLRGNNTPAILAVVYGNRDYEDALVELRDAVTAQGFVPLSAGAFIGEHSYSRPDMPVAAGRPDADDLMAAGDFGLRSAEKFRKIHSTEDIRPFFIKGNTPYREVKPSVPAAPVTQTELCLSCGQCVECCPTRAIVIDEEGFPQTDAGLCIKCCACVKDCTQGARIFDTPFTAMLHTHFSAPRTPEWFL